MIASHLTRGDKLNFQTCVLIAYLAGAIPAATWQGYHNQRRNERFPPIVTAITWPFMLVVFGGAVYMSPLFMWLFDGPASLGVWYAMKRQTEEAASEARLFSLG